MKSGLSIVRQSDVSSETAAWTGYLAGTATIQTAPQHSVRVTVSSRKRCYLEALKLHLGSGHKIGGQRSSISDVCTLVLSSSKLVETLSQLGITKERASRKAHPRLARDPSFWSGYVEARGSLGGEYPAIHVTGPFQLMHQYLEWVRSICPTVRTGVTPSGSSSKSPSTAEARSISCGPFASLRSSLCPITC